MWSLYGITQIQRLKCNSVYNNLMWNRGTLLTTASILEQVQTYTMLILQIHDQKGSFLYNQESKQKGKEKASVLLMLQFSLVSSERETEQRIYISLKFKDTNRMVFTNLTPEGKTESYHSMRFYF